MNVMVPYRSSEYYRTGACNDPSSILSAKFVEVNNVMLHATHHSTRPFGFKHKDIKFVSYTHVDPIV